MVFKHYKSVFIFRRSYRLIDNTGLIEALKNSKIVIPIFIFTPEQLVHNTYKSNNCIQFMIESLIDLNNDLKNKGSRLFFFYGKQSDVIKKILGNNNKINAIYVNMDYTPYSTKRDDMIEKVCINYGVEFNSFEDVLLNPIKSILTKNGTVYQKFTPYFNSAKKEIVRNISRNNYNNYFSQRSSINGEFKGNVHKFYKKNNNLAVNGGRKNALKILKNLDKFKKYNIKRNILNINTTRLSAYIKFGCVSIREVYSAFKKKLGKSIDLIKQLYWRDFYYNVGHEFPEVFKKGKNLKEQYNKIIWNNNRIHFNRWKQGNTGFPIVDASMREMNITGFMHNRGRLIVSNFLIKVLGINWELGEKYFAQRLVDYDPNVNNGNWGWSAGSGADSQPYFRIFNPYLQAKKHDPHCEYIKKWISELDNVAAKDIHEWNITCEYEEYKDINYPGPMVDYKKSKENTLKMYKKALYEK
jgi:deoxyribodipyrimidine photo-lyase